MLDLTTNPSRSPTGRPTATATGAARASTPTCATSTSHPTARTSWWSPRAPTTRPVPLRHRRPVGDLRHRLRPATDMDQLLGRRHADPGRGDQLRGVRRRAPAVDEQPLRRRPSRIRCGPPRGPGALDPRSGAPVVEPRACPRRTVSTASSPPRAACGSAATPAPSRVQTTGRFALMPLNGVVLPAENVGTLPGQVVSLGLDQGGSGADLDRTTRAPSRAARSPARRSRLQARRTGARPGRVHGGRQAVHRRGPTAPSRCRTTTA